LRQINGAREIFADADRKQREAMAGLPVEVRQFENKPLWE